MAQYFTDFSDSPTLTERWNTASYAATIQSSGIPSGSGTHALRILRTGSQSRFAVSWDNPGTSISGDVEVLAMVQHEHTSNTTNLMGPALYGAGTAGSESAYFTRLVTSSTTQNVVKNVSGGSTTTIASGTVTVNRNVWYRVRLQRTGTTIRTRIWQDGSGEPGTWDASTTDSDLSAGWTGIWSTFSSGTVWCAWIGVGTGGDAAPDAPVINESGAFSMSAAASMSVAGVRSPAVGVFSMSAAANIAFAGDAVTTPPETGVFSMSASASMSVAGIRTPAAGAFSMTAATAMTIAGVRTPAVGAFSMSAAAALDITGVRTPAVGVFGMSAAAAMSFAGSTYAPQPVAYTLTAASRGTVALSATTTGTRTLAAASRGTVALEARS